MDYNENKKDIKVGGKGPIFGVRSRRRRREHLGWGIQSRYIIHV